VVAAERGGEGVGRGVAGAVGDLREGHTGKTGSRVAAKLTELGLSSRTAARNGADVRFDWDDPTTHRPALTEVTASTSWRQ
jgi:hypothetical protein